MVDPATLSDRDLWRTINLLEPFDAEQTEEQETALITEAVKRSLGL